MDDITTKCFLLMIFITRSLRVSKLTAKAALDGYRLPRKEDARLRGGSEGERREEWVAAMSRRLLYAGIAFQRRVILDAFVLCLSKDQI